MQIFIDADGCPVVDITVRIAKENNIKCFIICDTSHVFEKDGVITITVEKGADSVDFKLVNMVRKGDVVVTQDYGLAAMCLARQALTISQNGLIFTDKNIDELLYSRYISKKIRNAGGRIKGPSKRTQDQNIIFQEKLTQLVKESS